MKITAVVGARKNGNTEEIVRFFARALEEKLEEKTEAEVEILNLYDYPVPLCTGCHSCILRGEESCPHRGAVRPIEEKLTASDGLILASPGYMFSVTAVMKNFLDHSAYNCHRPKYFGKPAFILSACTKWQEKGVFIPLETWASGAGFTVAGKAYTDLMPFPQVESDLEKKRLHLKRAANTFATALRGQKAPMKPGFGDYMIFNAFSMIARMMPNIFSADYAYFTKLGAYEGGDWYRPARPRIFLRAISRLLAGRIEKALGKMIDRQRLAEGKKLYKNKLI